MVHSEVFALEDEKKQWLLFAAPCIPVYHMHTNVRQGNDVKQLDQVQINRTE